MERTQVDPSVIIANVNLPTPKMKILSTSPVAPIHRKAKLLIRCLLKGAAAAATNSLALLSMVEDEMRYGILESPFQNISMRSDPPIPSLLVVGKGWEQEVPPFLNYLSS